MAATTTRVASYDEVRKALHPRNFARAKERIARCPNDFHNENRSVWRNILHCFMDDNYYGDDHSIAILDETQQFIRECLEEEIFTTQIFTNIDLLRMVADAVLLCNDVPEPILEFLINIIPRSRWKSVVHPKHNTTVLDVVFKYGYYGNPTSATVEYFTRFMEMGVPADHICNGNSTIFNVLAFGQYELLKTIEAYHDIDVNEVSLRETSEFEPTCILRNVMMTFLAYHGVDPYDTWNDRQDSSQHQERIIKDGTFDKMVHYMVSHGLNLEYRDALDNDVHCYISHYGWPTDPFTSPVGPIQSEG